MSNTLYSILYTANIIFLTSSLYSWVLKRFFISAAYKDNFGELFPARRTLASMYLLQFTELPYIFMIDRPEALFYINGTALLIFTSYLGILIKGYFFLEFRTPRKMFFYMHPVFLCWVALLLPLLGIINYTPLYHTIMTIVVLLIYIGYLYLLDQLRQRVMFVVRDIDENEYSNAKDFPVTFAKSVKWLPLLASLLLLVTFLINLYTAKIVRDIVFTCINAWFAIYTLNPHRKTSKLPKVLKKIDEEDEIEGQNKYRLTDKYCIETEEKIVNVIVERKLYLEEHFTMNDLIDILHINRNYISEVIARSKYQSFYRLVNKLRIEHACNILENDPSTKLEIVAMSSGFSSGSSFSQIFRRVKKVSPKEYITQYMENKNLHGE